MEALLVRVGADQTEAGGYWNAPIDSKTGEFVYVPIKEYWPGKDQVRPFRELEDALSKFGVSLPPTVRGASMHLDPDFEYLTYGDQGGNGKRGKQIMEKIRENDLLAFYAALKDVQPSPRLVYALIGLYVVESTCLAVDVPECDRHKNAHTRRDLLSNAMDILIRAKPRVSGRLERCIPTGSFRCAAVGRRVRPCYRVESGLLKEWGGLDVNDGYLQRSARLPQFLDAVAFYKWFLANRIVLKQTNN